MVNVTLSVEENVLTRARQVAASMGTSVNGLIRRYLAQLAGTSDILADAAELRQLSLKHGGHSHGRRFDRDAAHER
jgi:antitoxin component of RelBE/YafQ-DinJ toxin-antitoxin module